MGIEVAMVSAVVTMILFRLCFFFFCDGFYGRLWVWL